MKLFMYQTYGSVKNPLHFGGRIYAGDFDRKLSLSDLAERISSDQKFDQECQRFAQNRAIQAKYQEIWKGGRQ